MPHAVIIGGGIGGLTTAVALRQTGFTVAVYERSPELREAGAGITLWRNAFRLLERLNVSLDGLATPIRRAEMRTWSGKLLSSADLTGLAIGIHRADLQSALAVAAGQEIVHLGKECSGFEDRADAVAARFRDGSEAGGDVLIGADGIHSAIRSQRFGDAKPRYAGYTAWRGVARIDRPEVPLGVTLIAIGRGSQFGYLPIGGGRTYWFATRNLPEGGRDGKMVKQDLLSVFGDWYAPIPATIESTPPGAILRNDIVDRPPVTGWGEGRMTLLGDAAHPTTPNLGQGACQAIEDAMVLARCLTGAANIAAALREYEQRRYARTAMITNQSWRLGQVFALESPAACWLRDRAFSLLSGVGVRQTAKLTAYEA